MRNIQVCDPSGLLPTAACPNVVEEVFLYGNEPVQVDTLFRMVPINRDTGRLATIFTPPDLIDERAYISIPSEAKKWANNSRLEIPPETYDNIPLQPTRWTNTKIVTPEMVSSIRGEISITGKADGPGFSFYRLQYGKGANPGEWYQIREDSDTPVSNGILGKWDTTRLSGLFALQLLVVRDDQSAERATVLVSVDNQPPTVTIKSPFNGEVIVSKKRPKIVLQVAVDDDLGVDYVVIKMDGKDFTELTQPPYSISWKTSPGKHTMIVIATDGAGNTNQAEVEFKVE